VRVAYCVALRSTQFSSLVARAPLMVTVMKVDDVLRVATLSAPRSPLPAGRGNAVIIAGIGGNGNCHFSVCIVK